MGRAWSETAREAGRRSPRAAAPQQEKSARRLVALGPRPRSGLEALAAPVGGCWADGAVTCDNARCVTERWCSRAGEQARQRATGRRGVRGHGSPRGGVRGAWRLALCALAPVSRLGGGVPECRLLWDGWDARAVRRRGGEARSRRRKRAARLALSRDGSITCGWRCRRVKGAAGRRCAWAGDERAAWPIKIKCTGAPRRPGIGALAAPGAYSRGVAPSDDGVV